jgi:DNA-binding winged helix-turn-helix (wHTH) protein/predicted ATPase
MSWTMQMPPEPFRSSLPVWLDLANERLWCGDWALTLRPKTFALLRYLVAHPGQLLTKAALLEALWPEMMVSEVVLSVCIRELRRTLGDDAKAPRFIETVHRRGYRFIGHLPTMHPSVPPTPSLPLSSLPPLLLGRERQWDVLHRGLATALTGTRQLLFITGEAGLGKTTLVDAFLTAVERSRPLWIGRGQCLEHYGTGEAYLPVLEAVERLCRVPGGQDVVALLAQQAPTWVVQMPGLVSPADLEGLQRRVLGTTPERMLREMAEALNVLTAARPLILVLEDLHWSDYATLDLLAALAQRREPARLLVLGTYRLPDVLQRGHPLYTVHHELQRHGQCTELPLPMLSETAVASYLATRFSDAQLPAGLARLVHQRTEGNPLFMVTVVEDWVRRGWLVYLDGRWTLQVALATLTVTVPESLRQMLEQHLDRLSLMEQQVLEVGSVAGATFSAAAVAAGLAHEAVQVDAWCAGLARRRQWLEACGEEVWPDGTVAGSYRFTHALYQEVAYHRLTAARRAQLHRCIGEREEAGYGPQRQERAAVLAVHFARGRDHERALRYLQHAADNALRRYAYPDAITHLNNALALLVTLPETPKRVQQELDLQVALGRALMDLRGLVAPEVEQTYARVRMLCERVSETPQLFSALQGLCRFYRSKGCLAMARELGGQLDRLTQSAAETIPRLETHEALGDTLFMLGEYTEAWTHLEHGMARTDPVARRVLMSHHGESLVARCLALAANTLWCLGYPAQAVRRMQEAMALARELAHAQSLGQVQGFMAYLYHRLRDVPAVQEQADGLLSLATVQGFPLPMWIFWRGWALVMQGQSAVGLEQMRQGLAALLDRGQMLGQPLCLVVLAEAAGQAGDVDAGLRLLAEALTAFAASGRGDMLTEAYRLQGELLLRQAIPEVTRAEACFHQALAIARRQEAKSWELRAATSLSRWWQQQGKRALAYELLAPVYGWFTEGFDTADLQEAKALLEELRG